MHVHPHDKWFRTDIWNRKASVLSSLTKNQHAPLPDNEPYPLKSFDSRDNSPYTG